MEHSKEEIDELIKKALTEEEAAFYNDLDEQSLLDQVLGVYKGKLKWIAILTTFIQFIVFGLAIYCLIQFFKTEDLREMILWGTGMVVGLLMQSMLKLFHWLQMDKNAILREVKRVEFQIGVLASKLNDLKKSDHG